MRARALSGRAAALACLCLLAPAAAWAQGGVLDQVVQSYSTLSASWLRQLLPIAQTTFGILAAIEFALAALLWGLRGASFDAIVRSLVQKIMLLSLLFSAIHFFPLWIPTITASFEKAGQHAAGNSAVNPSAILDLGLDLCSRILLSVGSMGFLAHPSGNIVASFTALIVLLAYTAIAAQLCLVLVESYIVLTGGILFLGFAGCSVTAPLADRYVLYAFHVGTKIFFLYLLTGVGSAFTADWSELVRVGSVYPPNLRPFFEVLAGSLVFAFIVWRVPNTVASQLTDGVSFRLSEALRGGD